MEFVQCVEVGAPAHVVWGVYADLTRWPEWTASIRSLAYVRGTGLAVGNRVRIEQPRLPAAVWEVTALDPGGSWTWVTRGPGVTTTGTHEVRALDDRRTEVVSRIIQAGPVGQLVGRLSAGLTRRYLALEAEGLAARCVAAAGQG